MFSSTSTHQIRAILSLSCALVFLAAFGAFVDYRASAAQREKGEEESVSGYRAVYINRTCISDGKVSTLERIYQVRIPDGSYWYDRISGAWGLEGGPTAGLILPNLNLGGRLRADASKGNTGVFVNGRELHYWDVLAFSRIAPVYRGRYWVDAQGNGGFEGGPPLFNLVQLARQAGVIDNSSRKGSILSGMYDSGIGRVLGNGDFYISGNSSVSR